MKEQIIKIIESKAQGKYHLEIDEPDLEVIANEILKLFIVSQQRELLKAFLQYVNCSDTDSKVSFDLLDKYLNSL